MAKMVEHRSKGIAEADYRTNGDSPYGFDVLAVYDRFVDSLREPDNPKSPIGTQDYIDGYRELLKFCDALGYIFKFVSEDIVDKVGILQSFIDKDKKGTSHFDTLQQAIHYETEHNLIKTNPRNFTRTLLRLHRASLFLIQFLRGLVDQPLSETTAAIATRSYDATLSPHHRFLIRGSVRIGFRILPSRRQLDEIIFRGHKDEYFDKYMAFIKFLQQIYDTIQAFYAENNYLQLP